LLRAPAYADDRAPLPAASDEETGDELGAMSVVVIVLVLASSDIGVTSGVHEISVQLVLVMGLKEADSVDVAVADVTSSAGETIGVPSSA